MTTPSPDAHVYRGAFIVVALLASIAAAYTGSGSYAFGAIVALVFLAGMSPTAPGGER